ncbi:hypothetical protein [Gracilimonas sp.]|uniref:peroxiredoxin family protein n=1 Tax=Gracilimonas sp. TaxID=1974203 RepID=UPI0032EECFE5
MRQFALYLLVAASILIAACSNEPKPLQTVVKGNISVADSIDSSGDFSGIEISIIVRDSSDAFSDTLFNEQTDASGSFMGTVQFPEKRYFRMFISRNGTNLGNLGVILAENDTVTLNAELPGLDQTLTLSSREHNAMNTFLRVDRGFQRVGAFARSGAIPDSQMLDEVKKWSDLYWEVFEKNPNTIASYLAAEKSAGIVSSFDQEKMLDRIDAALPADYMISVALNIAKPYIAQSRGFEATSDYLDSLVQISANESVQEAIKRDKIMMYFDSSRVKEAKTLLAKYEEQYSSSESKKWARRIRYDLNYLAPGVLIPDFSFITMEGDTVSNTSLAGDVYILEISPFANPEYQNDYDRTLIINEIYKNYGLKIFTVPLDESPLTVEGFFEERRKAWSVAELGSFDVQDMIQKFNVVQVPTRFLIDENGVLIRKYERGEFEEVIQGLNKAFDNRNSPS